MELLIISALAFSLGASVGSFLNVVWTRYPDIRAKKEEAGQRISLNHPQSRCPYCLTPIAWRWNVPVLGYLMMRGRSRCCDQSIPIRYWFYEVVFGALFVGLYWGVFA